MGWIANDPTQWTIPEDVKLKRKHNEDTVTDLADLRTAADYIRSSFTWEETQEGVEYWETVHRKLCEIIEAEEELYDE